MIRTRATIAVALLAAFFSGCGNATAPNLGMPDSTFVATLSELRRIESDTSLDDTMRDSTRRLILRRHKVTSTQLEAASRILAQTPARASDLWRQIESVPRAIAPKAGAPRPTAAPGNNHAVEH
jgi:hypothetical protein